MLGWSISSQKCWESLRLVSFSSFFLSTLCTTFSFCHFGMPYRFTVPSWKTDCFCHFQSPKTFYHRSKHSLDSSNFYSDLSSFSNSPKLSFESFLDYQLWCFLNGMELSLQCGLSIPWNLTYRLFFKSGAKYQRSWPFWIKLP